MRTNLVDIIALVLLVIGGFNWGLIGLFNFDLVAFIFGHFSVLSRLVYIIISVAAVYGIFLLYKFTPQE
jgi:uncharacterized membrane protein YuzA (DUF378 family)